MDIKICSYIRELIDNHVTAEVADRELYGLMTQQRDLNVKCKAIEHYNKLKQRLTEKIEAKLSATWEITINMNGKDKLQSSEPHQLPEPDHRLSAAILHNGSGD